MALSNYKDLAAVIASGSSVRMDDGEVVTTKERLAEIHKGQTVVVASKPEPDTDEDGAEGDAAETPEPDAAPETPPTGKKPGK